MTGSPADPSKFEILKQPFASGPEVTEACLSRHTEAGKQFMQNIHWTWEYRDPRARDARGQKDHR